MAEGGSSSSSSSTSGRQYDSSSFSFSIPVAPFTFGLPPLPYPTDDKKDRNFTEMLNKASDFFSSSVRTTEGDERSDPRTEKGGGSSIPIAFTFGTSAPLETGVKLEPRRTNSRSRVSRTKKAQLGFNPPQKFGVGSRISKGADFTHSLQEQFVNWIPFSKSTEDFTEVNNIQAQAEDQSPFETKSSPPTSSVPIGEFSCPASPTESSASEEFPIKTEVFTHNPSHLYRFQASQKENSVGNNATCRKAKPQKLVSTGRRTARQRPQKNAQFERASSSGLHGSPMDFSPSYNAETHASTFWEDFDVKGKDEKEQAMEEEPKVVELRSAAAAFSIGDDLESSTKFCEPNGDSGENNEREGRAFVEEEKMSFGFQESWTNLKDKDNNEHFTFGVGTLGTSSSAPLKRHSQRNPRFKAARSPGVAYSLTSLGKAEDLNTKSALSYVIPTDRGVQSLKKNAGSEEEMLQSAAFPGRSASLSPSAVSEQPFQMETGFPASPRTAEQLCEHWRLRGNQAYANGDFPKAEEYYSRGANSISPNETSQSCIRAYMLCYSNRAATRMAVGRMREAITDCMRAISIDPNFLRVRLRAASCYLELGESKCATTIFKECLNHVNEAQMADPKVVADAADGIKKAQQLDEYTQQVLELLDNDNDVDGTVALHLINEALLISSHSDYLLEMKARALLFLQRYEEVAQLCEQSLSLVECNHDDDTDMPHQASGNSVEVQLQNIGISSTYKLWRWKMTAKAFFYLGRLEDALDLLAKYEETGLKTMSDKSIDLGEPVTQFAAHIRELLAHKVAGNKAFTAGKHSEAVEHYTAALAACSGDSRPFAAVCLCNRAAASQALNCIADAIADCSRAIALNPNYPKALSRRATLHEAMRDYDHACSDLRRLIALLENYSQPRKNGQTGSATQDLRQAHNRLMKVEGEMKKGYPVDHYMILGVDSTCSANEIKKAYRKAALKHHPDKAGQFLFRGEKGDDNSAWKEVADELRRDAERLFKMIGEAYAVLLDVTKRLKYDTDEELRKVRISNNSSGVSESYRYQYEKAGVRKEHAWSDNGYAQRWRNDVDAAQPDIYGRRGSHTFKAGGFRGSYEFNWNRS